ncbi:hypothetical protein [Paraburkholderia terrae]|uniref:hypothetical protein n=1 Tax=Paraburkholderia terrae TaxID=311230 RepID=UPI001EE1B02B|nr:hypothetical protein [Paraburkholderia terrae]GJH04608.1 hypothetical protein CBA19C8_28645 [Paraburkholderia terrae]
MFEETRQQVQSVAELEALLRRVAADVNSENGARPNTIAATEEYLKKGGSIVELIQRVEREYVRLPGGSPAARKRAKSSVYEFVQHTTGLSRDSVNLYARCYEKFARMPEALDLRISDMQLLLRDDADADLIGYIAERRRDTPDLRREEVRELIRRYRMAQA